MTMAQPDSYDAEAPVVDAVRSGDRYAFAELVRRHHGWVRGVVFGVLGDRDVVEDVVQQVWTSVWLRIGELRDSGSWRTWLYRLARNAAVDAGREASRRRRRFQALSSEAWHPEAPAESGDPPAGGEVRSEVMRAVQALPAMYREPFVLRHLSGWSYQEIAGVMGMPVDSVETRLVRARRFLRDWLKGDAC
jgi:RNA polymerase sigma-70 factor (ECF subfamily)